MTVLCLIEQADDGGVADVSLRALTFARALAASSEPWMYQKTAPDPANGSFTDGGDQPTGADVAGGTGGVAAVVFGDAAAAEPTLSEYGAGDAYAVELAGYAPQAWARALAGLAAELSATAVVAAGTDHGSEVMAHLGAITGLPMVANCVTAARNAEGALDLVRHRWAGSLLEDAVLDATPALLTVAVDAVAAAPAAEPAATAVHAWRPGARRRGPAGAGDRVGRPQRRGVAGHGAGRGRRRPRRRRPRRIRRTRGARRAARRRCRGVQGGDQRRLAAAQAAGGPDRYPDIAGAVPGLRDQRGDSAYGRLPELQAHRGDQHRPGRAHHLARGLCGDR